MNVNSRFVLRVNLGRAWFSPGFLVKQVCESHDRLLKGGKWLLRHLCLLDLTPSPFFQRVGAKQCTMTAGFFGITGYGKRQRRVVAWNASGEILLEGIRRLVSGCQSFGKIEQGFDRGRQGGVLIDG